MIDVLYTLYKHRSYGLKIFFDANFVCHFVDFMIFLRHQLQIQITWKLMKFCDFHQVFNAYFYFWFFNKLWKIIFKLICHVILKALQFISKSYQRVYFIMPTSIWQRHKSIISRQDKIKNISLWHILHVLTLVWDLANSFLYLYDSLSKAKFTSLQA